MNEIETQGKIHSASLYICRSKSRVARFPSIHLAATKTLAQHTALQSDTHHSSPYLLFIGILQAKTLVGKETNLVIHQRNAHTLLMIEKLERHICRQIHRTGIVFESSHIKSVSSRNIQFSLLTHCCRIEG